MLPPPLEITQLLATWRDGDQTALDQLAPMVDAELRQIAHRALGRQPRGQRSVLAAWDVAVAPGRAR
ncbi:MAG: ECF-type sigma factor [Blastocatellia bacterium]